MKGYERIHHGHGSIEAAKTEVIKKLGMFESMIQWTADNAGSVNVPFALKADFVIDEYDYFVKASGFAAETVLAEIRKQA